MTTPLRLGFLVSGVLHVAVVAAFTYVSAVDIPAADEPRPLTLQLTMFKPVLAALPRPAPSEPAPPLPVSEPDPPVAAALEPEQPSPLQVDQEVQPQQPLSEPRKVQRRTEKRGTVVKKPEPRRQATRETESRSAAVPPPPSPKVELAVASKPQPVTPSVDVAEKQHYLAALAAKINRRKYYPARSRRRGEEGRVVVHFVIRRNGELSELSIVESSGSQRLDAAALKTLRRVSPFRPIPASLDRDHWRISVPIAFSLHR